MLKKGAAVEELQCSGRNTGVSQSTKQAHVSFYGPQVGELQ